MALFARFFSRLAAASLVLAACATTPKPPVLTDTDGKPESKSEVSEPSTVSAKPGAPGPDEEVLSFDVNGDGKPDMFKFYPKGKLPTDPARPETGGAVLRKELDLNGDGKIDMWTWYAPDGSRVREAMDVDFDGKVDEVVFYEKNVRVRVEWYTAGHDKPDTFRYYEKNKLVRVERDRNADGKIDSWEYWENDQIDRIGEDNDYDGNVDHWIKPPPAVAKKN
jgi:hypothetical protein